MKERPILFSSSMVRALLDGRKTQTRRTVKPQPHLEHGYWRWRKGGWNYPIDDRASVRRHMRSLCPYGAPGDRLWVRETWGLTSYGDFTHWHDGSVAGASDAILGHWSLRYRASWGSNQEGCRWRPSIHMPRWASRITLELTAVRVERLQDISEADARAEGFAPSVVPLLTRGPSEVVAPVSARQHFEWEWNELHQKREDRWLRAGDDTTRSPWVWVLEFKRVTT